MNAGGGGVKQRQGLQEALLIRLIEDVLYFISTFPPAIAFSVSDRIIKG